MHDGRHSLSLKFIITLSTPLDYGDNMEFKTQAIEQLPRVNEPAAEADIFCRNLFEKRCLQQSNHDQLLSLMRECPMVERRLLS